MKKLWIILFVALMSSIIANPVLAAEKAPSKQATPKKAIAKQAKSADLVTQDQLGRKLVRLLGLSRFLPSNPSSQQVFSALLHNGISPQGGWVSGKPVTRADLARVIVQAMGLEDQVKKPSDPNAWIQVAKAEGISIDAVSQAADNVTPLLDPVLRNANFDGTTDPLAKGVDTGVQLPDSSSFGTDISLPVSGLAMEEVLAVISEVVVSPRRKVVTPN